MKNLVVAELVNGISMQMLEDKNVRIISDGALFLVTTEENSVNYRFAFEPTDLATLKEYGIKEFRKYP